MNLALAFAFWSLSSAFCSQEVDGCMAKTLIHSCGDLMIPKLLKLLMKVLLLRLPACDCSERCSCGDAFTFFVPVANYPGSCCPDWQSAFLWCRCPPCADAAAAPAAFLLLISQYPQFGCAFVSTHFMCHKPKPAVPGQIIKRPTGNWASGSSTGCGRVSFIRSLKTSELSVGSMYNGVSQQLLH